MKYYKCVNCFEIMVNGKKTQSKCSKCKAADSHVEIAKEEYDRLLYEKIKKSDEIKRQRKE